MNIYLLGAGVAALAFWWLNRREPSNPDDVTPARKDRFEAVESTWYTVAGLAENSCFKGNAEAQELISKLKLLVVEELKK